MIWTRQRQTNQLRSTLREFYPGALDAFDDLAGRDALAVLAIAATPTAGRQLSRAKIASALRRAGRQRRVENARRDSDRLRAEQLAAPTVIADAMGATVAALVAVIAELQTQISVLETELADRFEQHPDAKIIRSLPGLGMTLGARVLGEFGDDPNRYATAKCRKNYSGMSPITRASGKSHVVLARYARNRRLADACYQWAFATLTASPGARHFYDQRRAAGDTHHRACEHSATDCRHPPRLPPTPHPLQRTHRLGTSSQNSPLDTNHRTRPSRRTATPAPALDPSRQRGSSPRTTVIGRASFAVGKPGRIHRGFGPTMHPELHEHVGDVVLDRLLGQEQFGGDLPVRQPVGQQFEDPALLRTQRRKLGIDVQGAEAARSRGRSPTGRAATLHARRVAAPRRSVRHGHP